MRPITRPLFLLAGVSPGCHTKSNIFPAVTGGAQQMSIDMKVPFLGSIPLDPNLLQSCEDGKCFVELHPNSAATQPLLDVVQSRSREAHERRAESMPPTASVTSALMSFRCFFFLPPAELLNATPTLKETAAARNKERETEAAAAAAEAQMEQ